MPKTKDRKETKMRVDFKKLFGIEATDSNDLMLKLFAITPKYSRATWQDKRVEWEDEVDADAWEVLGGGFVYVPVGENPNGVFVTNSEFI
jgi:hypothetical protein